MIGVDDIAAEDWHLTVDDREAVDRDVDRDSRIDEVAENAFRPVVVEACHRDADLIASPALLRSESTSAASPSRSTTARKSLSCSTSTSVPSMLRIALTSSTAPVTTAVPSFSVIDPMVMGAGVRSARAPPTTARAAESRAMARTTRTLVRELAGTGRFASTMRPVAICAETLSIARLPPSSTGRCAGRQLPEGASLRVLPHERSAKKHLRPLRLCDADRAANTEPQVALGGWRSPTVPS